MLASTWQLFLTAISWISICWLICVNNPSHAWATVSRVLNRDNTEWSGTSSSSDSPRNCITCRFEFAISSTDSSLRPPFQIPTNSILNSSNPEYAGRPAASDIGNIMNCNHLLFRVPIYQLINLLQKIPFAGTAGYIQFWKTHAYCFNAIDLKYNSTIQMINQDAAAQRSH